jgi:ABC-2 type transport system permease protein
MAGVGALSERERADGAGPWSRLARSQYAALALMRWQTLRNGLRTSQGVFEFGARAFSYLIYGVMGVGLGLGVGAASYELIKREMWPLVPLLFWSVCLLWQTVPVALASFQEQFDMSGLLRFPLSFRTFFLLFLVFGLADISTLLGGLCCVGILTGTTFARPELFVWAALGLTGFAAFNILLVRVILAWIDRWLSQRRTREIVSALFVMFLLSLQLLNPALHDSQDAGPQRQDHRSATYRKLGREMRPMLAAANVAQEWLPPGLAAMGMERAGGPKPVRALESLGVLGLYVLAAGGLLAVRLRAEFRGENLGEAPAQAQAQAENRSTGRLLNGAGPMAAVMEKELHTMVRSLPLLYSMGAPLFMVLIFGSLFRGNAATGSHPFALALPLCVGYALLGSSQIIYNTLGTEGAGIQLLFLSPTPIRTVLLAKNIFHSLLFGLVAVLAGILASLRLGWPDATMVAATLAWVVFALPANLAVGNVFSLVMPHRMNLGRLTRRRASASSALLSMLVQFTLLGFGAGIFALCAYFGRLWWSVPIFLVLAAGAVYAWLRVLSNSDAMASQRKDLILAMLARTE